jgi:hypothetical protein
MRLLALVVVYLQYVFPVYVSRTVAYIACQQHVHQIPSRHNSALSQRTRQSSICSATSRKILKQRDRRNSFLASVVLFCRSSDSRRVDPSLRMSPDAFQAMLQCLFTQLPPTSGGQPTESEAVQQRDHRHPEESPVFTAPPDVDQQAILDLMSLLDAGAGDHPISPTQSYFSLSLIGGNAFNATQPHDDSE